jgi:hypothetical protein
MENLPDSLVCRPNGTSFLNRKEEIFHIEYGTISSFKEFKKEVCNALKVNYHSE